jgi:hypothetical protein
LTVLERCLLSIGDCKATRLMSQGNRHWQRPAAASPNPNCPQV